MKSISAALATHFAGDTTTLAVLWKVKRNDGVIMGFTTHDQDITYFDGSDTVTYAAGTGMTNTATQTKSDMSIDNLEVTGFLDSVTITENDIRAGKFDNASIEIRIVNWNDLTMGDMKLRKGTIGVIKMVNGVFQAEIRGLTQKLSTVIVELYGPICRAELGSGVGPSSVSSGDNIDMDNHYLCFIDLSLYRQSGSVSNSPDAFTIQPNAGLLQVQPGVASPPPAPANWFNDGVLTFTSGPMNGFSVEIKTWDTVFLKTFLPMPYQPQPGDTFTIDPGCNKTTDCFNKFNNIVNFRGEPFIPGSDVVLLYPNAK